MLFRKTQLLVFLFSIIFSSFTFSQTTCNDTSWNEGVDFDGANQHLKQVSQNTGVNAIRMAGQSQTVALGSNVGYTTNVGAGRPWATTIMFKTDRNGSNQHIWNSGEGAGSTDDNIYLRLDANGWVYFGWGRQGALNECRFLAIPHSSTGRYWGIYIASKGGRFNSSNATAANLADAFDIRVITNNNGDEFNTLSSNLSTSSNWTNGSTGGRMDRLVGGDFTIGGRGSNRSFHGQVASMVVTTLKLNDPMPNDAEIKAMITDPMGWLNDYKIGNIYGDYSSGSNLTNFQLNTLDAAYATQVWLMGDGTSDSYSNGIRNEVNPTEQNYGKLQLDNNMQNSIQSVNISGFSEAACRATSAVFGTETTSTLNLESFTAPSGGADGYAIYINDSNSFTAPSNGDEPTADLSWNDSGQQPVYFGTSASPDITVTDLDLGTTYYFQVYAYNDSSGTETYETTGLNASDATTADTSPPSAPTVGPASATTVTGTAEAGSTVTVTDSDGDVIGTATADSDGNYSVTLSSAQSNGSTLSVTATDASGNESEATTTRVVIGITYEGPSSNQTGTNITDNGKYGWISIDETLEAGQRFVMDNAFMEELFAEMGDAYEIRVGLKGDNWDNGDQTTGTNSGTTGEVFKGDLQLRISHGSSHQMYFQIHKSGGQSNSMYINTQALQSTICAFIEIDSTGDNIRMGMGRNADITQGDESTVAYSDWNTYKLETGDQGFGITSLDVMFLVTDGYNLDGDDYDGANVDWTGLTEVSSDPTDGLAPIAPAVSTASGSTVIGTAEFGSTVTVTDSNGDVIGTATADSDGNYSVTLSPAQSDGSTLTVTATDASGNESEETTTYIPISGFTHIAASASMAGTDVLDDGSAVSIDDTLSDGQRIVFSADWIKTNVWDNIPSENVSGSGDAIYIGILKTGHNLNSISDDDFAFAYKFWNDSGTSDFKVVTTVKNGGAAINSTAVQGTWNRDVVFFHDYSVTGHFHGLYNAAAGTGATIAVPTVYSHYSTQPTSEDVTIVIASTGPQASISTTGISEVDASAPDAPIVSTASADTVTGTAEAGSTVTVTDSDGDVIGTATTDSSGNYSVTLSPAQSDGSTLTVTATDATGNESDQTTTTIVLGITLVGPSDNQTGTNLFDAGDHGWATLDESLSAGERLTLTNAFLSSLVDAMPDNSYIIIGLKSSTWSSTITDDDILDNNYNGFKGNAYLKIDKYDSSNSGIVRMSLGANGTNSSYVDVGSGGTINSGYNAFIEISADGNNIRLGQGLLTANGGDDPATTPYCDWSDISSTNKAQTGDQDFSVTSLDVVIGGGGNSSGSIKTHEGMAATDVEWIIMSPVGVPSTPCSAPTSQATSAVFGSETSTSLNLESFTAPSGGADGYAIYINDSNSFTAPLNGVEPTVDLSWNGSGQQPVYFGTSASPNITFTDLDPGTTYYFQVYAYNNSSGTEIYETTGLNASDDTAAQVVPGITLEGPNANQSGTNLSDVDDWGWASINDPLGAGERVVFNNDFILDIFSSMPDNYDLRIGLKDDSWDNSEGNGRDGFLGGTFLLIKRESVDYGSISLWANGLPSFTSVTLSSIISDTDKFSAFIELDALGDKINIGLNSTDFSDELNVYSTAYCNWAVDAKATTNNSVGYNISTVDIMIRGAATVDNLAGFDTADVDWSEITQVAVPSPAPTAQATSAVFGTETSTSLNLSSFTAPAGGADGYIIYVNDTNSFTAPTDGDEPTADLSWNGSGQQPVYFGTSASPNITVTDLNPGTTYYYKVYAYKNCLESETYETIGLNATDTTTPSNTAPTTVVNTGSSLREGGLDIVSSSELEFDDAEEPDTDITYTLDDLPDNGTLRKNTVALTLGGTFTQDDINNNRIDYVHDGSDTTSDSFRVDVSDGQGGTIDDQTFNFTIAPVDDSLTITGITGSDKVYDGTTAASASGIATLVGVEAGDDVFLGGSPVFTFASANVGTGITISTSGYTINGADAGKYSLTQPTLSGDITAKELTITGITGGDKVYDGTTAASASGTATLVGVEAGDDVFLG
ncbi:Ig-like domain-containing protein, partial [Flavobacteriaceae bacterium]|nr:Ig-like domain-containing protein [Flavobacteriaceae bacterium]